MKRDRTEYDFQCDWADENFGQNVWRKRLKRVRECCSDLFDEIEHLKDAWYTFEVQRNVGDFGKFKDAIACGIEVAEDYYAEANWVPMDDVSDDEEREAGQCPTPQAPAPGIRERALEQLQASNERLIKSVSAARLLIVVSYTILDVLCHSWNEFDAPHDDKPSFTEWWRIGQGDIRQFCEGSKAWTRNFEHFADAIEAADLMAVRMLSHGVPLNERGVDELFQFVHEQSRSEVRYVLKFRVDKFRAVKYDCSAPTA